MEGCVTGSAEMVWGNALGLFLEEDFCHGNRCHEVSNRKVVVTIGDLLDNSDVLRLRGCQVGPSGPVWHF